MPDIIEITDLSLPELAPFVSTNEVQLKRFFEPEKPGYSLRKARKSSGVRLRQAISR